MVNQLHDPAAQTTGTTNGFTSNGSAPYGTAGFSNQVDQVFSKEDTPLTAVNGKTNGSTTLGRNNPVLTGNI
jgi:hypothetical protein